MTTLRNRMILLATAGLLAASAGLAQPGQPSGRQSTQTRFPAAPGSVQITGKDGTTVNVDFKGGTLGEFVAALRQSTSDPVNISLQSGADRIEVSPMSVREVSVGTALRAALGPRVGQMTQTSSGMVSMINFTEIEEGDGGKPVYCVSVQGQLPSSKSSSADKLEVISIQRLITGGDKLSPDVILGAIDTGLQLDRGGGDDRQQLQMKFHPDSGLLLVRGDPADVRVALDVVGRIQNDHDRQSIEGQQRRTAEISRSTQRRQTQIQLKVAEAELSAAKTRFAQTKQASDAGTLPVDQLRQAELEVIRMQGRIEMLQADLERLDEESKAGVPLPREKDSKSDDKDDVIAALRKELDDMRTELNRIKDQAKKTK